MKRRLAVAVAVGALGLALAAPARALSFDTVSGQSFEQSLWVTPTVDNGMALLISGMGFQYSSLSFEIMGTPVLAGSRVLGGNLLASFNDFRNGDVSLLSGSPYLVRIFGTTVGGLVGGHGTVTVTAINAGSITAVPEPGAYAMLLAGLGVIGAVALRRGQSG